MTPEYLSLSQAAAQLPGRPHISTLHRWRLRGVRGVKLRTCLVGGRRYTTLEWLHSFIDATSEAGSTCTSRPRPNSPREDVIERAERRCQELGL